jgi:hypothetical protein
MSPDGTVGHSPIAGYSSRVQLSLEIADRVYPLSHVGPDFVQLRRATSISAGTGQVIMMVDGRERRWRVVLPNGAVPFDARVETEDCDSIQ